MGLGNADTFGELGLGSVLFLRVEVLQAACGEDFAFGLLELAQGRADDLAGVVVATGVDQLTDKSLPMGSKRDVHSC